MNSQQDLSIFTLISTLGENVMNLHAQTQKNASSIQMGEKTMNNKVSPTTNTMLSTEIVKIINDMREEGAAELRHRDFMAKVLKVLGSEDARNFSHIYKDAYGRNQRCYALPKREAHLMVMSESYKVQAAVYDLMTELEQQASKPIDLMQMLNNPVVIRNLLLTYAETVIEKDKVIAQQAPKVAALERLSELDGSLNVTETAKVLDVKPQNLFTWLMCNRWIYRRVGSANWLGYQDKTQRGYVTHKVQPILLADGTKRICEQVRITPKGLAKLATTFQSVAI
jgi:phage antirepressor YoqD-like protein